MQVILVLMVFVAAVAGQSTFEVFASLPLCGQTCLAPVLGSLNCDISTLPQLSVCLCPDIDAQRNVSGCVQASCNATELYTVSIANQQLCAGFPVPSRTKELKTTIIVLSAITLPLILGRIFSRAYVTKSFWWDDVLMILCGILLVGVLAIEILMVQRGFGKHIWNINVLNVTDIAKFFYSSQILYITILQLAKVSILIFYLRVFPQRWFRISVYITMSWAVLHSFGFLIATALQCLPVRSLWDKTITPKCVNQAALIYSGAAFSIIEDLLILALPIPCISSLQLGRVRKFGVGLMFTVGSFSCVTSMIRIEFLKGFGDFTDATWDNVDVTIWSMIEIFTAAMCASFPAVRQLFSHLFPKIFSSTNESKESHNSSFKKLKEEWSKPPRDAERGVEGMSPRHSRESGHTRISSGAAVEQQMATGVNKHLPPIIRDSSLEEDLERFRSWNPDGERIELKNI